MRALIALIVIILIMMMSGCSSTTHVPVQMDRVKLNIATQSPLRLETVEWKVHIENSVTYYSLDSKNFSTLTRNMEKTQSYLFKQRTLIEEYKKYYE